MAASISASTRRAYAGALHRLDTRLDGHPLDDAALAEYLADRFDAGASAATAGVIVAAVRFRARLASRADPVGPLAARVLAGFRRTAAGRGPGQVTGVNWSQADAVAAIAAEHGSGGIRGTRDAAIIATASDAMLRVSEVAALTVADLERDGAGTITIRRSKTDQEGDGAALFLGPSTVARIRTWLAAAGIEALDAPLFQRLDRAGHARGSISARSIRAIITARAKAAGVEGRVSGHSLRVGAAQSLAAAGASVVEMQQAGRWQSPAMPARYARGQLAAAGAVARLRYAVGPDATDAGDQQARTTTEP